MSESCRLWAENPYFDAATRAELAEAAKDTKEIEDRFYRSLEFGTGGLRGLIGAGTNRINRYTVRHITQGLAADYIATFGEQARERGVVIAHGITAFLWDSLRPTPMLSKIRCVPRLGWLGDSADPPRHGGTQDRAAWS